MLHGLLVVNAFLKSTKFDELYHILLCSAHECGMELSVSTNAELLPIVDTPAFDADQYQFVLFWDKDVNLATQLARRGLPVFNSARSIGRCDDKALTYLALQKAGLPVPDTMIAPKTYAAVGYTDTAFVDAAIARLGLPMVLKECFGSFGQQVYLFEDAQALGDKVTKLGASATPFLFQSLVKESYGRDVRVNIVGNRVVASILRQSTNGDFRSNLTLGGSMQPYTPSQEMADLALRAVHVLGLTFAGVDMLFGKDGPLICEVNSNAHFKTTLACTGVNMATELLLEIAAQLEAQ